MEIELKLSDIEIKNIPIKIGEERDINIQINAIYNHEAPLLENVKIGNIIVKKKDEIIETIDIVIKDRIEKKNVIDYFIELIGVIPNYSIT